MRVRELIPWILLLALVTAGAFWGDLWRRSGDRLVTNAGDAIILPTCPANLAVMEFGGICKDPYRPGVYVGGVGYLTGVAQ